MARRLLALLPRLLRTAERIGTPTAALAVLLPALLIANAIAVGWLLAGGAAAETYVWIDATGVTHITDDPQAVPPEARTEDSLERLWTTPDDPDADTEGPRAAARGRAADRRERLIRGAVDDLRRGETARASVALEGVLRAEPANPQAHWYLALLDRQRGRYDSARVHLEAFLASAGDDLESWRQSARRRLDALTDEARLADPEIEREPGPWRDVRSEHFRVHYDPELGEASPHFAKTVLRYLEEAREAVGERLGAVPREAMGVVFYGKAAYLQAHRHRFSFQTIGFFDGRIHVVSAAHPAGELRALLFHEYSHAVFREQTGGDRPYWLNEGLAELSERTALSRNSLTRSERAALRGHIEADDWLPLRRLAPSFAGLDDAGARAAYLESTAAAKWLAEHTDRAQRAQLLALLGQGTHADGALRAVLGMDTDTLDASVRGAILADFPPEGSREGLRRAPAKLRATAP